MTAAPEGRFRNGITRLAHSLARGAGLAAARFPVAAGLIAALAALSNLAAASIYLPSETDMPWLLAALYGGAAAAVAGGLAAEARQAGGWVRGTAQAGAALLVGALIWFGPSLDVFAPALIISATLAIPLAPFVGRPSSDRFWTFTFWTGVGVVLAFFSVTLFMLGLSAIIEMVRLLFEVGLSPDAYEHIYVTAFTLIGPLFALGRIPERFDETQTFGDERLLGGVRILFDWIAAPLTLVTATILHLYVAKIVFTGELPKNEIGWIVTFFSLLVLSLRVAANPFINHGAVSTRIFARYWAAMLVVPLALLSYAIALRVGAEGLTLERYYLALGALAAVLTVVLQLIPRLRGDIRAIAGVPVLLLALSSLGPLGALEMVGRSQAGLIGASFVRPSEESGEGVLIAEELSEPERNVLRSRLRALAEVEQLDRVEPLLSPQVRESFATALAVNPGEAERIILSTLGLDRAIGGEPLLVFNAEGDLVLDTSGFDLALVERSYPRRGVQAGPELQGSSEVELALDGEDLVVTVAGTADRFALGPAVRALQESPAEPGSAGSVPPVLDLQSETGRVVRVAVRTLVIESTNTPSSFQLTMLLRRSDWPELQEPLLGGGREGGIAQPGGEVGEGAR